jgi:hypothetical protein
MNKPKKTITLPAKVAARNKVERPAAIPPEPRPVARKPAATPLHAKAVKKSTKSAPAHQETVVPTPDDSARVKAALEELARAQAELSAKGVDLLNVASEIGRTAAAAFRETLVQSLIQENLLQDLEQLRLAASGTTLPAGLQLLPEGLLNWFCQHLELSPHLEKNQKLEVPADRLGQYELQGAPPDSGKALVILQVLSPGWKHQGRTLVPPVVSIATTRGR